MEKGRKPEEVRQQKRARQTGSRGGGEGLTASQRIFLEGF